MSKRTCGHGTTQAHCSECQARFFRSAVASGTPKRCKRRDAFGNQCEMLDVPNHDCIVSPAPAESGTPKERDERLVSAEAVLRAWMLWYPNCAQLLAGWHCDTAWSEWDTEVRAELTRLGALTNAILESPNTNLSPATAAPGVDFDEVRCAIVNGDYEEAFRVHRALVDAARQEEQARHQDKCPHCGGKLV